MNRKQKQRRKVEQLPLPAHFLQLVFEHQDFFLQSQMMALSIPQLLAQGLQLSDVLRLPTSQLLLVEERLFLQVSAQSPNLMGLVS